MHPVQLLEGRSPLTPLSNGVTEVAIHRIDPRLGMVKMVLSLMRRDKVLLRQLSVALPVVMGTAIAQSFDRLLMDLYNQY